MLARASLLGLICMLVVACGGGSTPTPSANPSGSASIRPSASADGSGPVVDEEFCGTVADMESELAKFEGIAIKAGNRTKLKDQADKVKMSLGPISDAAPDELLDLVDMLSNAVDALTSATENYATSGAPDTVAKRLKRSITALHGAITDLREAALCSN